MNNGIELATSLFKELIGSKPTRAKLGHGSFITFDFGRDIPEQVKTRHSLITRYCGEWHLWVLMCAWRIDINKKPIAGSEDTRDKIENCLAELAVRSLNQVVILNESFDVKLIFGEDVELYLFSFYTQENTQCMLYTPGDKVFIAGPGSEWSYKDAGKS
jgi:hypothetical protein